MSAEASPVIPRAAAPEVLGVAILLWAAEPEASHRLLTPFLQASAAAAMDLQVELYFSARSVQLLRPGLADGLRAAPGGRSVGEVMREAVGHGARLLVCTESLHAQGIDRAGLIPECAGHGGAVQFIGRLADPTWRTLVF